MTLQKKETICCEKCSGRVEDENSFAHHYGCLKEDCTCHSQKIESWRERFGKKFKVLNSGQIISRELIEKILGEGGGVIRPDIETLKSFIDSELLKKSQEKEEAVKEVKEKITELIESYFKNLILIPLPQATKENLINLIKSL